MSRVAKRPIALPKGVELGINGALVTVKGPKGQMEMIIHKDVQVTKDDADVKISAAKTDKKTDALAGTTRAVLSNMVFGVSTGFEKKLELRGVGYRAQAQGEKLNLTLGFSHPVEYIVPKGILVETPSQTEILVKGVDKQKVGQVAAEIRAYRPPEPYKGKGVRYADEVVIIKEAKKK